MAEQPLADDLSARVARLLERGAGSPVLRLTAAAWGAIAAAHVSRPLRLPAGARVVGVGGAVLGGAGKTPLAIALARALAHRGPVALVGHAYRARPGVARVVRPTDPVAEVGDDALSAARALAGSPALVVVGPERQAAVDHAAALGRRVLVVDGLLQTAPHQLAAAILTLDGVAPWGAGVCPPAGDLRAPREALLAAADLVAAVGPASTPPLPGAIQVTSTLAGALGPSGERLSMPALARLRLGLLLTIARPDRVLRALEAGGVRPAATLALGDHARPPARLLARAAKLGLDGWLATPRCATKLPPTLGPAPVLTLDHLLEVGPLVAALADRV